MLEKRGQHTLLQCFLEGEDDIARFEGHQQVLIVGQEDAKLSFGGAVELGALYF